MKSNLTQEISQKDSRVKNQADDKTDKEFFAISGNVRKYSLQPEDETIPASVDISFHYPEKLGVEVWPKWTNVEGKQGLFLLKIEGKSGMVKSTVFLTLPQLEALQEKIGQSIAYFKEVVSWADIPENTEVV